MLLYLFLYLSLLILTLYWLESLLDVSTALSFYQPKPSNIVLVSNKFLLCLEVGLGIYF